MLILFTSVMFIFLGALLYLVIIQKHPKINKYNISSNKIPLSFDGYKILQISDLHNTMFGNNQLRIMDKIKEYKPDIIVFTGDMIDYRRFFNDIKIENKAIITNRKDIPFINLLEQLKDYPVYMVYGNHEAIYSDKKSSQLLLKFIEDTGAKFINNEAIKVYKNGYYLNLLGVCDPCIIKNRYLKDNEKLLVELDKLKNNIEKEKYNILLSHRPELLENVYSRYNIDIVLSGHTHGGQVRLPFINGLYAPHQGNYPAYDKGLFEFNNTKLIVSAGLGNSSFPLRVFNRPELILITLNH